jgi:hypothetical protein
MAAVPASGAAHRRLRQQKLLPKDSLNMNVLSCVASGPAPHQHTSSTAMKCSQTRCSDTYLIHGRWSMCVLAYIGCRSAHAEACAWMCPGRTTAAYQVFHRSRNSFIDDYGSTSTVVCRGNKHPQKPCRSRPAALAQKHRQNKLTAANLMHVQCMCASGHRRVLAQARSAATVSFLRTPQLAYPFLN